MSSSPEVILLRSADEEAPDRYVAAFDEGGWQAICKPVLTFEFPRQEQLRDRLDRPEHYAGVIATSPRAATALARVFSNHEVLARAWEGGLAYVVGPKTAELLRSLGLRPRGAKTGSAEALAGQIIDDVPEAPLLFLSGNRRRETLPTALRTAEVPFEELVVYETHTRSDLDLLPKAEGTPWLVFFSPSGLDAVNQTESADVQNYRLAAIGPTTAEALEAEGHVVEAVAEEPSPEGLVAALEAAGTS